MVDVVLPTPPFWLHIAMTFAGPCTFLGVGSGIGRGGRPVRPAPGCAGGSIPLPSSVTPRLPLVPCPAGVGPPVLAALRSSLALVFGCSCLDSRRDVVRPQQPAARERHTGGQQPATGTAGQQEVQRVGPDELAEPDAEYR